MIEIVNDHLRPKKNFSLKSPVHDDTIEFFDTCATFKWKEFIRSLPEGSKIKAALENIKGRPWNEIRKENVRTHSLIKFAGRFLPVKENSEFNFSAARGDPIFYTTTSFHEIFSPGSRSTVVEKVVFPTAKSWNDNQIFLHFGSPPLDLSPPPAFLLISNPDNFSLGSGTRNLLAWSNFTNNR